MNVKMLTFRDYVGIDVLFILVLVVVVTELEISHNASNLLQNFDIFVQIRRARLTMFILVDTFGLVVLIVVLVDVALFGIEPKGGYFVRF